MAYLRLIRSAPDGLAVRGKLYLVDYNLFEEREELHFLCPTLENADYLIPPLIYRLTVTYSPKFRRLLPLVNQVPRTVPASPSGRGARSAAPGGVVEYRSGIRFHPGSRPEHSRGCILVRDRAAENRLRELIMSEREVRLDIINEDETRQLS